MSENSLKKLAATLYAGCRPLAKGGHAFPFAEMDFRFFSFGRYALREAFVLAGVGKGDTVLFPEFICRDVLAAANSLGATIAYYPVDKALRMAVPPDSLPPVRAIVAVNYFGFPQELAAFEAYCRQSGAILIEDNAHGFLSRDSEGQWLGTRGDIGVFSFRKSMPILNGSGVVVNRAENVAKPAPQLASRHYDEPALFRAKRVLRHLAEWHMTWLLYRLIGIERKIRAFRTGSMFATSGIESEWSLPGQREPDARLPKMLETVDAVCEVSRRRALYSGVEKVVVEHGGIPVFPELPDGVAPYGFPFYASVEVSQRINRMLSRYYMDCYPWPELPAEIQEKDNTFYNSIYLVNFIW